MCGIAGRYHADTLPAADGWADRADRLLAHRGPDGRGQFRDSRCELVHRRLALIDLSATGEQPMANEDGTIHVIFNGEIYNYQALRAELRARGHQFRSTSDTEVLVHLYEELGEAMVSRLRGIFAYAIYDRRRAVLLLARDRYGVKPLFYAWIDGQCVFASELKAILALPVVNPRVDRQAVYDYLGLAYVPEPATGFAEIHALPAGAVLLASPDGHRVTKLHSTANEPDPNAVCSEVAQAAAEALLDAVEAQSIADVPVAALLSGGIDSSLVVAAHSQSVGTPIETFNVRFPDKSHDETPMALTVAECFGTRHHTIDIASAALTADALFDLVRHFDQPFADTSFIPMYWISKSIRDQGIICTLSGDGGDEAFGGYAKFWRVNRLVQLMDAPVWVRRTMHRVGAGLTTRTRDWGRQVSKAVHLAEAGRDSASALVAGLLNSLSEEQKQELVPAHARAGLEPVDRHFEGACRALTRVEQLSVRLTESMFRVSLPSEMLRKVDMMSMRAGIEVRVPLLDDAMVALGLTLPHRLKTDGRTGKRVLRAVAARWLPAPVAAHPKHGFGIPLDVMLPATFHDAAADLLLSSGAKTRALLAPGLVSEWLQRLRHSNGGASAGGAISREGVYHRVFTALSLELWMQQYGLSW